MRITLTCLLILFSAVLFAQPAYKIQFKVKGLKDTTAYLGYYYGESTMVRDTARVNSNGEATFDGKLPLVQGVYFLVVNKMKLFELVVGSDQEFSLSTNTEDYIKNMVVNGDHDNKLFFDNMHFNMERYKEAEPFIKILQDTSLTEDQKKEAREGYNRINEKVMAHQDELIAKNPQTVTAKLFKVSKPVKVPDPPKNADGSIDSTFQLRWYREHFFDNMDLADETFIRMPRPFYRDKIYEYYDKLFVPHPDSLMRAVTFVISKARKTQETFKYATWMSVIKFESHEIMGLDAIYVKLIDDYFNTGLMDFWINDKTKKNLKDAANRIRKSLIGETGPNLSMQDSKFQKRSLYDLKNRYTILYIFDPDCGHCREETPKLVSFYDANKTKFDIGVFAVSADTSMQKMRDYIKEMHITFPVVNGPRTYTVPYQDLYDAITTPTMYILDSRKKIIGKKIPADRLGDFFINYERVEKMKLPPKM